MSKFKHGAYLWLKERKIHPSIRGHKKLQKYLNDLETDLIKDLGGPGQLTAAKEILIKTVIEAYGFILLASMYTKKEGILDPILLERGVVELQPVLGRQFIAFMNACRQSLVALGLERKAKEGPDLMTYVDEKYGKGEGDGEK